MLPSPGTPHPGPTRSLSPLGDAGPGCPRTGSTCSRAARRATTLGPALAPLLFLLAPALPTAAQGSLAVSAPPFSSPAGFAAATVAAAPAHAGGGAKSAAAFGAFGGDRVDDTVALQGWLDDLDLNGGCYTMGPGTYVQSGVLTLVGASDFIIDGCFGTLRFADDPDPVDFYDAGIRLVNCTRFELRNLVVDGNRAGRVEVETPAHSLIFQGCRDFKLSNVRVDDAVVDGFYFGASVGPDSRICERGMVMNCSTSRAWRNGASVVNGRDIVFVGGSYDSSGAVVAGTAGTNPMAGIDVEANPGDEITFEPNVGVTFMGVTLRDNMGFGIQLTGTSGAPEAMKIDSCHFSNDARGGVSGGPSDVVISGCTFKDFQSSDRGIIDIPAIADARSIRIEGNLFEDIATGFSSVYVHGKSGGLVCIDGNVFRNVHGAVNGYRDDLVISNNVVEGSTGIAFHLQGDHSILQGNQIIQATKAAVYVKGNGNKVLDNIIRDTFVTVDAYGSLRLVAGVSDVRGNLIELQSPNRQAYAIRVDATADVDFLKNNVASGYGDSSPVPSVKFFGTPSGIVSDNIEK